MQRILPSPRNKNSEHPPQTSNVPKPKVNLHRTIRIISFLSIAFEDAAIYLNPVKDLYEASALAPFLLLLCALCSRRRRREKSFFVSTGLTDKYRVRSPILPPLSSTSITQKTTFSAFQFPVITISV